MIPLLLALLAAPAPKPATAPTPAGPTLAACVKRADGDAAGALAMAKAWAASGGGVAAGECLGLAQTNLGDWKGAADSFAATADLAGQLHDVNAANLWVSAGNAALAGGDPRRARDLLDRAIPSPTVGDPMRGEAYLDRARADVALADLPQARADMDQALQLVPADPMAWLLSATLARRMGDLARARTDIGEAATRAPAEADILVESGNIYAAVGDMAQARGEWTRARNLDPTSDAAKSATADLAASGGVPALAAAPGR